MSIEITMPKLGFEMQAGTIVNWLKQVGDTVKAGEPLVEIETDKATVEVETFGSGVLTDILARPGQAVAVGTVIGMLDGPGRSAPKPVTIVENRVAASPAPAAVVAAEPPDLHRPEGEDDSKIRNSISPLARRMAREKGIDISVVKGTGPGGMIVKRDVLANQVGRSAPSVPDVRVASLTAVRRVPLSQMKKTIARRMMMSNAEVPQFYVSISIEMDRVLDLRTRYNDVHPEQPLSINDLIVRAAALTLCHFPHLNSSYHEQELEIYEHINVGIAVALDDGLMTVVLKDADRKTFGQIAKETSAMIQRAREGKVKPEDIEGSSFTISNLGMFGIEDFCAIINPPEAAILAIGAVQTQPKYAEGKWMPCSVAKFTLTVDHRVSDGAEAARFLKALKTNLEEPVYLI